MNRIRYSIIALVVAILFSSCFRKEDTLTLSKPGNVEVATIAQGSDYANQIFFDLNDGNMLVNDFAMWDLAFENGVNGFHIWINGGKGMYAGVVNETNIDMVQDTVGLTWRWDSPTGNPDSTAIGNWTNYLPTSSQKPYTSVQRPDESEQTTGAVYLVDRGNTFNNADRYWKIKFLWVTGDAYKIKYARLDNTYKDSLIIEKSNQFNFSYFTFDNGGQQITVEPNKSTWDIVFTRYRYVFYSTTPYTPYVVSGVLLNPTGIYAGVDSTLTFEEIDYQNAKQVTLVRARDIIGYNWKTYSFDSQSYLIAPNRNYIIRDEKGYYWKLRFIDFYNESGEKGYPKFEYQRL
jgi:hypothetical protein